MKIPGHTWQATLSIGMLLIGTQVCAQRLDTAQAIETSTVVPRLSKLAPVPSLRYPLANTTFDERITPTIMLKGAIADAFAGDATMIFYACEAAGLSCTSSAVIAGVASSPPYEVSWTPPKTLAMGAVEIRYLLWVGAQNSLGEQRNSEQTPIVVLQPPPAPSVRLIAPNASSGFVSPAAPVLYATAVAGNTSPPSTITRVDFLDGIDVIGSVMAPNVASGGYAVVWSNPMPGAHEVRAVATDSIGDQGFSDAVTIFVVPPASPPQVVLAAPRSGQTISMGDSVGLSATATSEQGHIQRVEFLAGATIIATAFVAPYSGVWRNPPAGRFAIVARAFDDLGMATATPAAYVFVPDEMRPPAIVLAEPVMGATFQATAQVTLAASTLVTDAPISHVDFYANETRLGAAAQPPFAYTWSPSGSGPSSLTARVYDTRGSSATSAPVTVNIVGAASPTLALIAPQAAATFVAPATVEVAAVASSFARPISRVDFTANALPIGSATVAPYRLAWHNVLSGSYTIVATAFDAAGAAISSQPVEISVQQSHDVPDAVALTSPANGQTFVSGDSIRLQASTAETSSRIARVDFLDGTNVLGTAMVPPYELVWSGAPIGHHTLTARATDRSGASTGSPSASIEVVDVTVDVASGIDGATTLDDHIRVAGVLRAPRNSALVINGHEVAIDTQGGFVLDLVDLAPGQNLLTLTLNTLDSAPQRRTLAINSSGPGAFRVAIEPGLGYAPFAATLGIANPRGTIFSRIEVDTNNDGLADITLTELSGGTANLQLTMPNAGTYPINVTAYDSQGQTIFKTTRTITVLEPAVLGRKVVDVYQTMAGRLAGGNVAGALQAFTGDMRERFGQVLANLATEVPEVARQLGTLVDGVVSDNIAELTLARDTPDGKQLFMIYLIRGNDGVWRIESM